MTNPRKEIPCRIEPRRIEKSLPLLRLASLASPVFRLMPWHFEAADSALAVYALADSTQADSTRAASASEVSALAVSA